MKIAISGKGGVGKTTISSLLVFYYLSVGKKVLAVDADPDGNLGQALGIPDYKNITPIIEMKELIFERTGVLPGTRGSFFKMNPKVDDIPDKVSWSKDNLKFIVMGGIRKAGGGCACPENVFLKNLIAHLIVQREEVVIMDMQAGLEHIGRATAHSVDIMLVVVEPGQKSIDSGQRIVSLSKTLGLRNVKIIANKLHGEEDRKFIEDKFQKDDIIGFIPFNWQILNADRENRASTGVGKEIDDAIEKIVYNIKGT